LKNEFILRLTAIVQLERELDKLEYYNNIKDKNNNKNRKSAHRGQININSKSNTAFSDNKEKPIIKRKQKQEIFQKN
jgi:hypothetical protein